MELAKATNEYEERLVENIETHGFQFTVVSDPEGVEPVFVYTIGLWETYGHPELITIGLHHKMAAQIFETVSNGLKAKGAHLKNGETRKDFITGFECKIVTALSENFKNYLLSAAWRYKGVEFPVFQIVFQDANHYWPWDNEASDQFVKDQPLLG